MHYRVGLPFWKVAVLHGLPISLRVDIRRDEEAGVYVARSPDLDGLVVEARSLDDLRLEALGAAEVLLELALQVKSAPRGCRSHWEAERKQCAERVRLVSRIERLRGLCKTAVGMLHDAGRDDDAEVISELIGDMEV